MADSSHSPTQSERNRSDSLAQSYIKVEALLMGISILLLGGAALLLAHYGFTTRPEVVLTMVILLGIVVLLVAVGAFVALLWGFGLADGRFALGLPDGSVRAILALSLLLVFSMISIFLYWDASHPQILTSAGVTADQLAKLAAGSIVSIAPGAAPGTFDVRAVVANQNAQQLGQQLVTILGTLVTAIAAFYFGATSVASASKLAGDGGAALPVEPKDDGGPAPSSGAGPPATTEDASAVERHALKAEVVPSNASQPSSEVRQSAFEANLAALRTKAAAHPDPIRIDRAAD